MTECEMCGDPTDLLTPLDIEDDGEKRHLLVCQDCEQENTDSSVSPCQVAHCPSSATHHIRTARGEGMDVCYAHLPGLRSTLVGPVVQTKLDITDSSVSP